MNQPSITYALHIPKPCHSSWDDMLPNEKGRHCLQCNKTVTDFTQWSDEDIQQYFILNQQGTCGRFYNTQLSRIIISIPSYIVQKRLPVWKRFLLLLLICFGTMLAVEVKADPLTKNYTETSDNKKQKKKKRKRYTQTILAKLPIDIRYVIDGFTQTKTFPPQVLNEYNINYLTDNVFGATPQQPKKEDAPVPKNEPNPLVAILPSALAIRTSVRKKRK